MAQIGLALPTAAPDAEPTTAIEFGKRAEAAGAHSVWALDRLVFGNHEPLLSLTAVAATTTRVGLGTCVLLATLRPPTLLAKMIATLDSMSGGRVTMGFGVGSRPDDFAAAEIGWEHRGTRMDELVRILRTVWRGDPVDQHGKFYDISVGPIGPRPAQSHIPIWFGGSADAALRRIVRLGDGFIGSSTNGPGGFKANWQKIAELAEKAGRDPAEIHRAALIYACVDDDRSVAEAKAIAYRQHYYGGRRPIDVSGSMIGSADACVRIGEEYLEAGVQTLIIASATADLRYFDRLCEKVVPRLITA
jgi:probable F420-dependent oxidoreductase